MPPAVLDETIKIANMNVTTQDEQIKSPKSQATTRTNVVDPNSTAEKVDVCHKETEEDGKEHPPKQKSRRPEKNIKKSR